VQPDVGLYADTLSSADTLVSWCRAVDTDPAMRPVRLEGRVYMPPNATPAQRAEVNVLLTASTGEQHRAHCLVDGTFTVSGLKGGMYLMDVIVIGFMFPEYRVDVHPGFQDPVRVSVLSSRAPVGPAVVLRPLGEARYYMPRKPINIRGLIMSPYGLMASALPPSSPSHFMPVAATHATQACPVQNRICYDGLYRDHDPCLQFLPSSRSWCLPTSRSTQKK
jgi:Protein of unknown function (DUF2012)